MLHNKSCSSGDGKKRTKEARREGEKMVDGQELEKMRRIEDRREGKNSEV